MQRSMLLLALAAICIAASGCAAGRQGTHCSMMRERTPVMPPAGFIVTAYKAPLTVDFNEVPVKTQRGSVSSFYLRIPFTRLDFAFSDVSLDAAAKKGGLSEASYADYRKIQILGIFGVFTVNAYGE